MKRNALLLTLVTTMLLAASSSVSADPGAPQEMKDAQFFLGTWSCTHTEGQVSGTYTTTITNALDNLWFKQTYDFAATSADPGFQAEYFFGYDPRVQRWVRFGAMSSGMYFAMVGKRTNDTWSWTYVLPAANASAVYTKKSDSEYTVEGPSYTMNGAPVTEHHVCKKES